MDLYIVVIIILILSLVIFLKLPEIQRQYGNYQVRKAHDYFLNSEDYYMMKNVVLLTFNGLQKFDYILVSRFGIFVIMAQHYSGTIVGAEHEAQWIRKVRGKSPLKFSNPSQVLSDRCQTLSTLLNLPIAEIFPIALFTGISGFQSTMSDKITYGSKYLKYVCSIDRVLYSAKQIEKFVSIIEAKRKRQGLVNESDKLERSQQTVSPIVLDNKCSSCGSEMEIRMSEDNSKTGRQILVCQLYPTCRNRRSL